MVKLCCITVKFYQKQGFVSCIYVSRNNSTDTNEGEENIQHVTILVSQFESVTAIRPVLTRCLQLVCQSTGTSRHFQCLSFSQSVSIRHCHTICFTQKSTAQLSASQIQSIIVFSRLGFSLSLPYSQFQDICVIFQLASNIQKKRICQRQGVSE